MKYIYICVCVYICMYICVCMYGIVNESVSNVLKIMSKNKLKKIIIFENISDIVKE